MELNILARKSVHCYVSLLPALKSQQALPKWRCWKASTGSGDSAPSPTNTKSGAKYRVNKSNKPTTRLLPKIDSFCLKQIKCINFTICPPQTAAII